MVRTTVGAGVVVIVGVVAMCAVSDIGLVVVARHETAGTARGGLVSDRSSSLWDTRLTPSIYRNDSCAA